MIFGLAILTALLHVVTSRSTSFTKEKEKIYEPVGIAGGKEITIEQAPFIGALECYGNFIGTVFIISDKKVMTEKRDNSFLPQFDCIVRVGTSTLLSGGETHEIIPNIYYNASKTTTGQDKPYVEYTVMHPFKFGKSVQKINLSKSELPIGSNFTVYGWGVTGEKSSFSKNLRMNTGVSTECSFEFEDIAFCSDMGVYTYGDFGGPAVYNNEVYAITTIILPRINELFYIDISSL